MNNGNMKAQVCGHKIIVNNVTAKEKVNYSLLLLKGKIYISNVNTCPNQLHYTLNVNNNSTGKVLNWPVKKLQFKCLVDLQIGNNVLHLQYCSHKVIVEIHYEPRDTLYCVTPVYIICRDHSGRYQSPVGCDNSVEVACKRISLGSRLIQCLMAEKLYDQGYGRKTFQLESEINPSSPECVQFHSSLLVAEAQAMNEEDLWLYFGREIMSSNLGSTNRKFLAFLSCTEWQDGEVRAHAALGGGGLALFGTACLHTWPLYVEDVMSCFLNTTTVDTRYLMDDSCYRGTYGGCFSTTLGSVCHELGHTFDLGHSKHGIMGRGFDNVHLVFVTPCEDTEIITTAAVRQMNPQYTTVSFMYNLKVECVIRSPTRLSDVPCTSELDDNIYSQRICTVMSKGTSQKSTDQEEDDLTHWSPSCAVILAYHRWFNNNSASVMGISNGNSTLTYDQTRHIVTSSAGIRVVELRGDQGLILNSWQFVGNKLREQFVVPVQHLNNAHILIAEDSDGYIIKHKIT